MDIWVVGHYVLDMSKQSAEYWREKKAEQRLREKGKREGLEERLPWPYNAGKAVRWGEGVAVYVAMTEDEKEAMKEYSRGSVESVRLREDERPEGATDEEWAYAVERAGRARRYAEAMSRLGGGMGLGEVKYQDAVWQWENREMGRERWRKKIERGG